MLRCASTRCAICCIDYDHRVTLHDHIFTETHINRVKKLFDSEGMQADALREIAAPTTECTEKEESQRLRMKAVRDRRTLKPSSLPLPNTGSSTVPQFPYNFLYGLQPGLAPLMYDPNLMGTPIPMLQIPESVMAQITGDLTSGRESTKFTQDGKTFQQLVAILPLRDFQCAGSTDS
ncbi:unnamed protein product, partial [Gongylonema pulchrum]